MNLVEHILYNGNIITLDKTQPKVSALAINRGYIIAYGLDDEMLGLCHAGTIRENLGGRTIIPGLIDAHIHWQNTARSLHQVDLFEVSTKTLAIARIEEWAANTPPGVWITGHGWFQDVWPDKAFPTAADLDNVTPQHPVYLRAKSGHAAWVNSLALKLSHINANTPNPEGGEIVRDSHGQPTGLLLETAMNLVADHIPSPSTEQITNEMRAAQELALAAGLTGIHDFDGQDCFRALQLAREHGELSIRVVKNINKEWLPAVLELGVRWGFGDEWIRIGGLKIFADGALGPRTAHMIAPYKGEPENYGIVVTESEEMVDLVSRASAAGLPATIHAIGDRAVHDVLNVYETVRGEEKARGEAPESRRHRIEHVQVIHEDDVHRLAELKIIASMQPLHATSDYVMADRYWGTRSALAYNPRIQIDQGVMVAFGSDSPVEPLEPLKGIHAAVTRQRADGSPGTEGWYPEARLTVDEALRGFTSGPAYAAGMEHKLGKLAPGYLADLVVLDRDLYSVPSAEILDIQVLATMVDGQWRFGGV